MNKPLRNKTIRSWAFSKPPAKEAVEVKKRAAAMRSGKAKSTPLSTVMKRLGKI